MTRQQLITVNRQHRNADQSHLAPINGRFNVAERAIRQARIYYHPNCTPEEYSEVLDRLESIIVNDNRNW